MKIFLNNFKGESMSIEFKGSSKGENILEIWTRRLFLKYLRFGRKLGKEDLKLKANRCPLVLKKRNTGIKGTFWQNMDEVIPQMSSI